MKNDSSLQGNDDAQDVDLTKLSTWAGGDFEFFERYGCRRMAFQMILLEVKALAADPDLESVSGQRAHEWIAQGNSGVLSFEECLAWLGIYDVDGQYMDGRIRQAILANPAAIVKALTKCEAIIDGSDIERVIDDSSPPKEMGLASTMSLTDRIDHVYADELISIDCYPERDGMPFRMSLHSAEVNVDRPGRSFG